MIKPVPADNVNYVNTSYITDKPRELNKMAKESKNVNLDLEELPNSSFPIGVGGSKSPTSNQINTDIIPSHQAKNNTPGVKTNPLNKQINKSAAADIDRDHPRLRGNNLMT